MKKKSIFICCFLIFSCTDQNVIRKEEARKEEKKRREIFQEISTNWNFKPVDFSEKTYVIVQKWSEWNNFYHELLQKPQTDIGAFQRKTKQLVEQSENLQSTIPYVFNTKEMQSRFSVLETKLKMLKTYITLDDVPKEKVVRTISEIETEIETIVNRMKTIVEKTEIQTILDEINL